MKQGKHRLWLIAFCILLFTSSLLQAEEPGDVRGAYFDYDWQRGKFRRWEPFLKISHPKHFPSSDGEPEIWGFRPWNLEEPDETGKTSPVNIAESRFIPCDKRTYEVVLRHPQDPDRVVKRSVRCPDGLWR